MSKLAFLSVVFGLAACAPKTSPVAAVSAAESGLAAAGKVAMAYLALPVCGATSATVCGQPKIRAQIKTDFDSAYAAVTNAQTVADGGGSPDMTAVTVALTLLQSDVKGL